MAKKTFLVKLVSKIVNFNIESCLKISDNLFFNEKNDFYKSLTLSSFILNFSSNSVSLIFRLSVIHR